MTLAEIIRGLLDLVADRESFVTEDEPDSIFAYDAEILREAVKILCSLSDAGAGAVRTGENGEKRNAGQ